MKSVLSGVTTKTPTTWYSYVGTTPTKHILTPDGEMLGTVEGSNAAASISYIHTDHLTGSAVITNSSGAQLQLLDYHPWGTIRINNQSSSFNEKRKFAGHEYDTETGLSYMLARYYNPTLGRFLSEDTAFLDLGDADRFKEKYHRTIEQHLQDPQALNSYAYGLNNPVTFRDPQGEIVPLIVLGVWAAVEIGLGAYDAYSTFETLRSSDASTAEKAASAGGFAAGLALPGGGYGAIGKQTVKHRGSVMKSIDETINGVVDRMTEVRNIGKQGEIAAGIVKNTERIPSVVNPRSYRIPDGLDHTNKVIQEVKNVRYQPYTNQLKDFTSYARSQNYSFELFVKPFTTLSQPLNNAVNKGDITLKSISP